MDLADILEFVWHILASGFRRPGRALRHLVVLALIGGLPATLVHAFGTADTGALEFGLWLWAGVCTLVGAILTVGILLRVVWFAATTVFALILARPSRD